MRTLLDEAVIDLTVIPQKVLRGLLSAMAARQLCQQKLAKVHEAVADDRCQLCL